MWASHSDFLNVRFQLAIQAFPIYIYIYIFFFGGKWENAFRHVFVGRAHRNRQINLCEQRENWNEMLGQAFLYTYTQIYIYT